MMHIESPRTGDQAVEQMIKAAGADVAPRITPADIEANIVREHYFTAWQGAQRAFWDEAPKNCNFVALEQYAVDEPNRDGPLGLLTFCVLVLKNGFTVTGESACASPENFNAQIGRRIARENAVEKIWPLMGYELKSRLASEPKDYQGRVRAECAELNGKLKRLDDFMRTEAFFSLPAKDQYRLSAQSEAMETYAGILRERIAAFNEGATK